MPCDTRRKPQQTLQERKAEVIKAIQKLDQLLANRKVRPKIGPQGGITFEGWNDATREGVTDACAYRRLQVTGSSLALAQIAQAEAMAGRTVNKQAVAQGVHSHDGGHTWHDHKG